MASARPVPTETDPMRRHLLNALISSGNAQVSTNTGARITRIASGQAMTGTAAGTNAYTINAGTATAAAVQGAASATAKASDTIAAKADSNWSVAKVRKLMGRWHGAEKCTSAWQLTGGLLSNLRGVCR